MFNYCTCSKSSSAFFSLQVSKRQVPKTQQSTTPKEHSSTDWIPQCTHLQGMFLVHTEAFHYNLEQTEAHSDIDRVD